MKWVSLPVSVKPSTSTGFPSGLKNGSRSLMDEIIGARREALVYHDNVLLPSQLTSRTNNNNNNDRLTAFDPGQPG